MTNIVIEGDFSNVNYDGYKVPEKEGFYILKIVEIKQGETKAGDKKLDFIFEIVEGEYAKQKFPSTYSVGHSKPKTRAIATDNVARLYKATTGQEPERHKLETAPMMNKPFGANLRRSESQWVDQDGSQRTTVYANLDNVQFLNNTPVQQTAPQQQSNTAPWA